MFKVYRSFSLFGKIFVLLLAAVFCWSAWRVYGEFMSDNTTYTPAYGGVYKEGYVGTVHSINPVLPYHNDAERDIEHLIFSGLVKYNPLSGKTEGDLADCSVSQNVRTYTCVMKDNLYWQDGQSLTADDVIFTYKEVIQNPNFEANNALKAIFDGVEINLKEDGKTIEFVLPQPDAYFDTELGVGILPRHILGMMPVNNLQISDFNFDPIGSGPYKIESLNKSGETWAVRLKYNEKYYGERPYIDEITLYLYPSFADLYANLSQFNTVKGIPADQVNKFSNNSRFEIYDYNLPSYVALFLNTGRGEPLNDAQVRYGVLLATDKKTIAELANGKAVDTPYLDNPDEFDIEYNLERAQGAFYDAGYTLGEDGKRYKDGNLLRVKLMTSGDMAIYETIARMVATELEGLGMEVEVAILAGDEFNAAIRGRNYDILLFGQNFGYNPDLSPFWHSRSADAGLNFSNYKNYSNDVLLDTARADANLGSRDATFRRIAKFIASPVYDSDGHLSDGVAGVFLYTPNFTLAIDERVHGVELGSMATSADRFYLLPKWYMKENKTLQSGFGVGTILQWLADNLIPERQEQGAMNEEEGGDQEVTDEEGTVEPETNPEEVVPEQPTE